jgi:hypothetical protein
MLKRRLRRLEEMEQARVMGEQVVELKAEMI